MRFHNPTAELYIPDALEETAAMRRVTHLGIGAHQDDLEFMALHGILECYQNEGEWFAGVTCTNGAGSARTGPYAKFSNEQMQSIRRKEQNLAAEIGQYGVMIQLDYPSSIVKERCDPALRDDLVNILNATKPEVIYTHNLADKHDTHIGVAVTVIHAIRSLPPDQRPKRVLGCEGWRDLDWMPDSEKVVHNLSGRENLASALNGVFDSQISGGKRYDLGVSGRRRANATFFESHAADRAESLAFAMDLTPLTQDDSLGIVDYVDGIIQRFRREVIAKIQNKIAI